MIRIFFIILLTAVIISLFSFSQTLANNNGEKHFFSLPFLTLHSSPTDAILSISPENIDVSPNQKRALGITLNSGENSVERVQIELAYNPLVLKNVQVTPGDFFSNPIIQLNDIDQTNGRVSYVISSSQDEGEKKIGTVANLNFDAGYVGSGSGQAYKVFFLPKTSVYTADNNPILQSTSDGVVTIHNK